MDNLSLNTPPPIGPLDKIRLGQWYEVERTNYQGEVFTHLACVMQVGSNYVELKDPLGRLFRIHFKNVADRMTFVPNADAEIQKKIDYYQTQSRELLRQVQELTTRLGLAPVMLSGTTESDRSSSTEDAGSALAVLSETPDLTKYAEDLKTAKTTTLPKLFEEIKKTNEQVGKWLTASQLPLKAQAERLEDNLTAIDHRIFNISLYAGLSEQIELCRDGAPAALEEKLNVMQRRLYMDEECLLNYETGGMEFHDLTEFDRWLARPENMTRILPFERTLVAMRVRRTKKERKEAENPLDSFINFQIAQADKLTFLYIRNGERLYRLASDLDFDELIFPGETEYSPGEDLMIKIFSDSVKEIIPRGLYESKYKEDTFYTWEPFNQDSVFYDDAMTHVMDRIRKYNRIALIIQGLFDRSDVFHPHGPVKVWDPENFSKTIALHYDGTGALTYKEAPDFESYRNACNKTLNTGSVVVGQELFWLLREGKRESERRDHDYRYRDASRPKTFWPEGNPGPGALARIAHWDSKKRTAQFRWCRERLTHKYWDRRGDPIPVTIKVPEKDLFNVDAYVPGDYKQFFQDPRTRAEYLKWAPALLRAEEYHAGKLAVVEPAEDV